MTVIPLNGIQFSYEDLGRGEPVVLVMGSGGRGRAWQLYQTPALTAAGYRSITVDNRGIPPTDICAGGFTVDDMVDDLVALVGHLGLGRCRFVGTSMGAQVVQELALARPDLVSQAVLMATRGRGDRFRRALSLAEIALHDSGVRVPDSYRAVVQAMQNLSPRTLDDDEKIRDWLEVLELSTTSGEGVRAQLGMEPFPDRLDAYRKITVPCLVIGFEDDLITPPHLGRELAAAIPGAAYELIPGCGHFGYLEDYQAVNKCMLAFFGERPV
ncbi:alpha/beta fold hydrolase [Paractinoplanes rishiriensis]|uniref:Hydrolase n=1 Tax=Paractinoplanes rishiriensis TaxID=1050105 RepID=A0A919KBK8_9ACTN|nr:alpha/beta hydrolase [Actinoplanes rishiriensis]GIF02380.1 hydrolase [Actinoplanes rishiriensis]